MNHPYTPGEISTSRKQVWDYLRLAAIQLNYLMAGFNAQREDSTLYQYHSDLHGGHIGITVDFYDHALVVAQLITERLQDPQGFPGVFEYEITEDLGKWLFEHPDATQGEFEAHARHIVHWWFQDGLAGQASAESCAANNSAGDSNHVELNSPQLVGEKKESTMKVNDLISTLQNLREIHGDVDVVVRGNTPKGFVDALEVRSVKTTKRRAVYIGKPSRPAAQE